MKVKTIDNSALESICKKLTQQILNSDFRPELILGIENGGKEIAIKIFENIDLKGINLNFCVPIKKDNKKKNKTIRKILKFFPTFILDSLRILEAKMFFSKKHRGNFIEIKFPENLATFNKILVVDDAVDSGETLFTIIDSLKRIAPKTLIKTAVLTITKDKPSIYPDYYIYNNHTLLRFPWSIDAK